LNQTWSGSEQVNRLVVAPAAFAYRDGPNRRPFLPKHSKPTSETATLSWSRLFETQQGPSTQTTATSGPMGLEATLAHRRRIQPEGR